LVTLIKAKKAIIVPPIVLAELSRQQSDELIASRVTQIILSLAMRLPNSIFRHLLQVANCQLYKANER
jgi:hypothetical protein